MRIPSPDMIWEEVEPLTYDPLKVTYITSHFIVRRVSQSRLFLYQIHRLRLQTVVSGLHKFKLTRYKLLVCFIYEQGVSLALRVDLR